MRFQPDKLARHGSMSSRERLLLRVLFLACAVPAGLTTKLVQVFDDIAPVMPCWAIAVKHLNDPSHGILLAEGERDQQGEKRPSLWRVETLIHELVSVR